MRPSRPSAASLANVGRDRRGAAQLGPQVIALVVVLNTQLGLSFGKMQQRYGLTVTRSGLVHAVHRAARQARLPEAPLLHGAMLRISRTAAQTVRSTSRSKAFRPADLGPPRETACWRLATSSYGGKPTISYNRVVSLM
jgi:hypothetical protein